MADFLTRLIQRTSGRAKVIKPLIRSSFSPLPPVNESISEFEETVSFDGINESSSTDARPAVRDNLLDTGKKSTAISQPPVIDNLLVEPAAPTPISRPKSVKKTSQEPEQVAGKGRVENLSGTKRQERKTSPEPEQVDSKNKIETSSSAKRQERKSGPVPKLEDQPKSADMAPPVSRKISPVSSDKIQRKSVESVPSSVTDSTPLPTTLGRIDRSDRVVPTSRRSVDVRKEISDSSSPVSPISPTSESIPVDIKSGKKEVNIQKPLADIPLQLSRRDLSIPAVKVPVKSVSNIAGRDKKVVPEQKKELIEVKNREINIPSSEKEKENQPSIDNIKGQTSSDDTVIKALQRNIRFIEESNHGISEEQVIIRHEEPTKPSHPEDKIPPQLIVENVTKYTPDKLSGRAIERVSFRDETAPPPDINVTIGRVEISSLQQPDYQQKYKPSVARKPKLSLDAYLKARDEEKR